ncbi:hypothetical protein N597_00880 [Streptococcus ilei]|uniref:hypothetical protein n=1 Tax=Streptococcus ilei TaxID=1156431 RepID=UPI0003B9369A|nr:hypothetical protein [Streptococcus ilei]AGY37547.1 hypothetical protein N597_00880 [Streptococcus ilei]
MSSDVILIEEYAGGYNSDLFFKEYLKWDAGNYYSSRIYLQIIRHLIRYGISDNHELILGNKIYKKISMSLPNLFGLNQSSVVAKWLVSVNGIYEIRINTQYRKQRIIFSPSKKDGIVISFYFDKHSSEDQTNLFAKEAEDILNRRKTIIKCSRGI